MKQRKGQITITLSQKYLSIINKQPNKSNYVEAALAEYERKMDIDTITQIADMVEMRIMNALEHKGLFDQPKEDNTNENN